MLLMPADRFVHSIEEAVAAAQAGARRTFEIGAEEYAVHLVARPDTLTGGYTVTTITTQEDRALLPYDTLPIARMFAAHASCVATIWIVPWPKRDDGMSVRVERPGTIETSHAAAGTLVRYSLERFVAYAVREVGEYDLVALPANLLAYAERFGGADDSSYLGPTAAELDAARTALAGSAASREAPARAGTHKSGSQPLRRKAPERRSSHRGAVCEGEE